MENLENQIEFTPPEDMVVFPHMCMSSLEPVRLREKYGPFFSNPLFIHNNRYRIDLTAFQKEQEGDYFLTYVVGTINSLIKPEYFTGIVSDLKGLEARDFILKPLSAFHRFKKAILIFDNRSYTFKQFEDRLIEWRNSLEGVITDEDKGNSEQSV